MPMYGSGYVFSKPFFTGWVTVGIIWIFGSLGAVGLFPIWEGRKTLASTFRFILADAAGKKKKRPSEEPTPVEATPGDATPTEKEAASKAGRDVRVTQ